jgi:hypothetical protein
LFHIYEKRNQRGYWVYFSEKRKQTLFLKGKVNLNYNCMRWPGFRGRFYNQYTVNEKLYREKKKSSLKKEVKIEPKEQRSVIVSVALVDLLKEHYGIPFETMFKEIKSKYGIKVDRKLIQRWREDAVIYKDNDTKGQFVIKSLE